MRKNPDKSLSKENLKFAKLIDYFFMYELLVRRRLALN